MTRDEAIKYNALYKEVELAISNISGLGFDVTEFKKALKDIHNSVNENVKYKYVKGMAEASYIQSYSNGISELNKLKNKLDNYDIYVRAHNMCDYVNMKIDNNISNDELDKLVSKMIYVLKSINKSPTIDYDNEKHIVEKIYETAYNVIKLEIVARAESQLYLFVKNEDVNISYFNNLILKDVEKIDLKDEKNNAIKTKMYELGENGIYSNYLDLELIKLILLTEREVDLQKIVTDKLNDLLSDVKSNLADIYSIYMDMLTKKSERKIAILDLKAAKMKLKDKIVSTILAASIFLGGGIGIHALGRKLMADKYIQHTEYYSASQYDSKDEGVYFDEVPDDAVVVRIANNSSSDKTEVMEYDLSQVNLETIYDYDKYVNDNYDTEGKDVEIQLTKYAKNDGAIEEFILYLAYVLVLFMIYLASVNPYDGNAIISFKFLKKLLKEKNEKQDNLDKINKEITDYISVLYEKISKDETLKRKFDELYNANKFLLNNPQELYERINNLDALDTIYKAKTLIREKE